MEKVLGSEPGMVLGGSGRPADTENPKTSAFLPFLHSRALPPTTSTVWPFGALGPLEVFPFALRPRIPFFVSRRFFPHAVCRFVFATTATATATATATTAIIIIFQLKFNGKKDTKKSERAVVVVAVEAEHRHHISSGAFHC
jgi:hypothetical protein